MSRFYLAVFTERPPPPVFGGAGRPWVVGREAAKEMDLFRPPPGVEGLGRG